jgi:4-amino-4-deoxychorismate lyase
MDDWYSKGQAVDRISISDRGFQYGDGLFETIAIRNGEPRLLHYHIDRLTRGCHLLGIRMPTEEELSDGILQALGHSDVSGTHTGVKVIVSAGSGLRGYGRAFANSPAVLFRAFGSDSLDRDCYRAGVDTVICGTRLASGSATAGLKTLNRLEQVLARSEFAGTDVFEGLTMDAEDNIICGTMSNVFFVSDNCLYTPAIDQCGVEGVMRRHVIETLSKKNLTVTIRPCSLPELESCDEVFLSNSQFGVVPVKSCMATSWPVGKVTLRVMAILADSDVTECRL